MYLYFVVLGFFFSTVFLRGIHVVVCIGGGVVIIITIAELFCYMNSTTVYPFWAASSFLPLPFNSSNNISHHSLLSVLN